MYQPLLKDKYHLSFNNALLLIGEALAMFHGPKHYSLWTEFLRRESLAPLPPPPTHWSLPPPPPRMVSSIPALHSLLTSLYLAQGLCFHPIKLLSINSVLGFKGNIPCGAGLLPFVPKWRDVLPYLDTSLSTLSSLWLSYKLAQIFNRLSLDSGSLFSLVAFQWTAKVSNHSSAYWPILIPSASLSTPNQRSVSNQSSCWNTRIRDHIRDGIFTITITINIHPTYHPHDLYFSGYIIILIMFYYIYLFISSFGNDSEVGLAIFFPYIQSSWSDFLWNKQKDRDSKRRTSSIKEKSKPKHEVIIPIVKRKKCKKAKWFSEEALQIAEKRREVKGKGEKERHIHLNAEFQRIARRDKKDFFFFFRF